jgi:outer membrane lipoprotein-sorting protein
MLRDRVKRTALSIARGEKPLPHGVDLASDLKRRLPNLRIDLIFDVGANVGQTAHDFRTSFPQAKILSFEPDADSFSELQASAKGHANVSIFNLGFSVRPGRVRFDYNSPSPVELIADGKSVAVRDRNLASQDLYPISQTPLRFLLADRIDLLRDTNLVAVYGDNIFLTVVLEEKQIVSGNYKVMLMFDAQNLQLKQWVVTDPQGMDTTVAVYNLDTKSTPDPGMFKIDYTRYVR